MLKSNKLEIKNLSLKINNKQILNNINLTIPKGETHILFGPNGSGKSSLLKCIMGISQGKIEGKIIYEKENIIKLETNQRAKLGIAMMYQNPPLIKGVNLKTLLNSNKENIQKEIENLEFNNFLDRDINDKLSGGEIKKSEVLQILKQDPKLILLDEPESGIDIENLDKIGHILKKVLQKDSKHTINNRENSGLIITHTGNILDFIKADKGYIIIDGQIKCSGNPYEIFKEIQRNGFKKCISCQSKKDI